MKILFATDGSDHALQAAAFLARVDFARPYELIIATASYDPTISTHEQFAWADEWHEQESARIRVAQDQVENALSGVAKSIKRVHRVGPPSRELLCVAKEEQVDLIVLGAIGHSAMRRMVLGSVSDHVATHAECSVLVVRAHELGSDEPLRRILVAFDGSEPAISMIEELQQYELSKDAEISVATALHEYGCMEGEGVEKSFHERQGEWYERLRDQNEGIVANLREQFPKRSLSCKHASILMKRSSSFRRIKTRS